MVYSKGMTKTAKAPTDAELMKNYEQAEAARARAMRVEGLVNGLTARGRSLAQAKRSQLAVIVIAMGLNAAPMSKAAMLTAIEGR